jgi:RNA polymerase sigma-70 factor (ECF subfamily)
MAVPEGLDDSKLISSIIAGDVEQFRHLVCRYQRPVFGMGMSFLHSVSDAEDFTQDVFLKAFQNLAGFEGRARFSTWLYRIAYRTAINQVERRKEYKSLAEEDEHEMQAGKTARTPEEDAVRQAVKEAVCREVKELPERYRVCIDLYFFYDRSFKEIAKITGFPENTIKSHVFRAKKILKEKLSEIL